MVPAGLAGAVAAVAGVVLVAAAVVLGGSSIPSAVRLGRQAASGSANGVRAGGESGR